MTFTGSREVRSEKIKQRQNLSDAEREALSSVISGQIAASDVFASARTVMLYSPVRGEVSLQFPDAVSRGKQFVYPVCLNRLEMAAFRPDRGWRTGLYGIREPDPACSARISPVDIDLVICPLTVFDDACHRIGSGAGYYDRFLPRCTRAIIAGAAYEFQKTEKIIPEPWDIAMDMVFTEKKIYLPEISSFFSVSP